MRWGENMKTEQLKKPLVLLSVFLLAAFFLTSMNMGIDQKRTNFIELKEEIQEEMRGHEMYKCCLETPCTYCIEKDPKHGEGAACTCLEDIVNGVQPCGECIGEIMEGHGSPFLSKYFAQSIAEEMGESHLDELREMMSEKYEIPVEEQY